MTLLNKIDSSANRHAPRHDAARGMEFRTASHLFVETSDIGPTPFVARDEELTAVLPSLALGGAERIVLDWIQRLRGRRAVHLVALRTAVHEYTAPAPVRLTRCHASTESGLRTLGQSLARTDNRLVLCHLLTGAQRAVLRAAGAHPVAVLHNLRAGWIDAPEELLAEPHLIVVAENDGIGESQAEAEARLVRRIDRGHDGAGGSPGGQAYAEINSVFVRLGQELRYLAATFFARSGVVTMTRIAPPAASSSGITATPAAAFS